MAANTYTVCGKQPHSCDDSLLRWEGRAGVNKAIFPERGIHKIVIDFASINGFDLATKRAAADRKLIRMKTIRGQNQTL